MTNLCPGYRENHHADSGRCCCGLRWRGTMPMHTERGAVVGDPEEYFKKLQSRVERNAVVFDGTPRPYCKGHPRLVGRV